MIPTEAIAREYLHIRRQNPFIRPATAWKTARFIVGFRFL